jgi:hypothetical protein
VNYVFVNFFLEIYPDCPITPDNLIRANACFGRNVSPWIRDADII